MGTDDIIKKYFGIGSAKWNQTSAPLLISVTLPGDSVAKSKFPPIHRRGATGSLLTAPCIGIYLAKQSTSMRGVEETLTTGQIGEEGKE